MEPFGKQIKTVQTLFAKMLWTQPLMEPLGKQIKTVRKSIAKMLGIFLFDTALNSTYKHATSADAKIA